MSKEESRSKVIMSAQVSVSDQKALIAKQLDKYITELEEEGFTKEEMEATGLVKFIRSTAE